MQKFCQPLHENERNDSGGKFSHRGRNRFCWAATLPRCRCWRLEGHSRPLLCAPLSSAIPSLLPLLDLAAVGGPLGTPVLASDSCRLCEFGRSQVSQMVAVEIGDERGWLTAREPWEAGVWV